MDYQDNQLGDFLHFKPWQFVPSKITWDKKHKKTKTEITCEFVELPVKI